MSLRSRTWHPLLAALVPLVFASLVQAGYFRRYPEMGEPQAAPQPQPRPQAVQGEAYAPSGEEEEELPAGLLGDALHGRGGLTVEYIYTGEVFTNMRGGVSTRNATQYGGVLDVVMIADLDEMGFFPGGTVFVYGQNRHGRAIGPFVGDAQGYSNIETDPFTQISEYWWERSILDGDITFRLGKQDTNAEFAVVDLGGDFILSSFGFQPTIEIAVYPNPSMAVAVFFDLTEWLSFKAGVWDGAPDGRTWGFSGTGDTLSIFEFKAEYAFCDGRLPGDFHVGMWYHSGDHPDLGTGFIRGGAHGVYMGMDQMILKEACCDDGDDQGLGVFAQYGWAPEDRAEIQHYFGTGLVYKGLFHGRDDDVTGIGLGRVLFSDRLRPQSNETTIELFHKIPLTPYVTIQPDLQYIARPSGQERDAFLGGLRFEVVL